MPYVNNLFNGTTTYSPHIPNMYHSLFIWLIFLAGSRRWKMKAPFEHPIPLSRKSGSRCGLKMGGETGIFRKFNVFINNVREGGCRSLGWRLRIYGDGMITFVRHPLVNTFLSQSKRDWNAFIALLPSKPPNIKRTIYLFTRIVRLSLKFTKENTGMVGWMRLGVANNVIELTI